MYRIVEKNCVHCGEMIFAYVDSVNDEVVKVYDEDMNLQEPKYTDKGLSCTDCHNELVHGVIKNQNTPVGAGNPSGYTAEDKQYLPIY